MDINLINKMVIFYDITSLRPALHRHRQWQDINLIYEVVIFYDITSLRPALHRHRQWPGH